MRGLGGSFGSARGWLYFARRLGQGFLVVFVVSLAIFLATRTLGDPLRKMLPVGASEAQYQSLRERHGFNDPLPVQFVGFIGDAARLDFGDSLWRELPAAEVVIDHLPATFLLVGAGLLIGILGAVPLGVMAALKPGSWQDRMAVTLSLLGLSLPQFWLGAILILIFAVRLGILPTSGGGGLEHLILPAFAVGLPIVGKLTQVVRTSLIDELERQYVTTARARGLSLRQTLWRHVARNALLAIAAFLSLETTRTLAGTTVVVEAVFSYPGLGRLAVEATSRDDVILLQAIVLVVAMLVVIVNLLFDIAYSVIDPRIRLAQK